MRPILDTEWDVIDELLRRDKLIDAVKYYRTLAGIGLREALKAVQEREVQSKKIPRQGVALRTLHPGTTFKKDASAVVEYMVTDGVQRTFHPGAVPIICLSNGAEYWFSKDMEVFPTE